MGKSHKKTSAKGTNFETGKSFSNEKKKEKNKYSKNNFKKKNYESFEEVRFKQNLSENGYIVKIMDGDGNCLFRSLADQIFNDPSKHFELREQITNYIEEEKDHFSMFLEDDEPFDDYLARMKDSGEWGGHQELYAASQCLNVNILVYQADTPRYKLQASDINNPKEIYLSYHGECHYNSLKVDHDAKLKSTACTTNTQQKSTTKRTANEQKAYDRAKQVVSDSVNWVSEQDIDSALERMDGNADNAIEYLCSLGGSDADTPVTTSQTAASVNCDDISYTNCRTKNDNKSGVESKSSDRNNSNNTSSDNTSTENTTEYEAMVAVVDMPNHTIDNITSIFASATDIMNSSGNSGGISGQISEATQSTPLVYNRVTTSSNTAGSIHDNSKQRNKSPHSKKDSNKRSGLKNEVILSATTEINNNSNNSELPVDEPAAETKLVNAKGRPMSKKEQRQHERQMKESAKNNSKIGNKNKTSGDNSNGGGSGNGSSLHNSVRESSGRSSNINDEIVL